MKLARLGHSAQHKARISASLKGKTLSAETRAKISASMKGHAVSQKAREAGRKNLEKANRLRTPEGKIETARQAAQERYERKRLTRFKQRKADQRKALEMGRKDLYDDIKRSHGWYYKRTLFDPSRQVSSGYVSFMDKVIWHGDHVPNWRHYRRDKGFGLPTD